MQVYFNEQKQVIQIDGITSDHQYETIQMAVISLNLPGVIRRGPTTAVIVPRTGQQDKNIEDINKLLNL